MFTPSGLELRHLRAFVAVAEALNFGRAARSLHLTQPSLSRQIRQLERLLGTQLFARDSHSVSLTAAGTALLPHTRVVLADLDAAVSSVRDAAGEAAVLVRQLWEPIARMCEADAEFSRIRSELERIYAHYPPPDSVEMRPVNAGGVPGVELLPARRTGLTIVYLHGGGMVFGSAYGYRGLAGRLAVAADATTIVPDYRLAPEHPFPAGLDDAVRAYQWVRERGADPNDIVLAGDSTGGALVLSTLLRMKATGEPMPRAAILLCPAAGHVPHQEDSTELSWEQRLYLRTTTAYLGPDRTKWDEPADADLTGLPRVLVQIASGDVHAHSTRTLFERAKACGVDITLETYAAEEHVFHAFWSILPDADEALERAGTFAKSTDKRK
ncbi:alpha/beta hydrolase fold domain-containing protein [Nocardia sp. NPDC058658]|uniref:alpha/beta hydrolase fold domain-containing protein n=1 Tax=Nocardia sp. NPDC058658 TaxID=3346580 RepID=UPI0036698FAF